MNNKYIVILLIIIGILTLLHWLAIKDESFHIRQETEALLASAKLTNESYKYANCFITLHGQLRYDPMHIYDKEITKLCGR